jgi:dihydroceramidase
MDASWTALAAPALVDWCEPDYVVSSRVAEWWNTLSSLTLVLGGLVGAWRVRAEDARFPVGMLGIAVIGAGSAAFHGTLLRAAQAADELPMIWLGLACVWAIADRARPPGAGQPLARILAVFGALFCVAYATVPWAFHLFIGVYGVMVAWVFVRTVQLSWFGPSSETLRRWAALTLVAYVGGFAFFWVPEHVILSCDSPLQAFQLHAWWHLGAGVGTYAWWMWALQDRRRAMVGARAAA